MFIQLSHTHTQHNTVLHSSCSWGYRAIRAAGTRLHNTLLQVIYNPLTGCGRVCFWLLGHCSSTGSHKLELNCLHRLQIISLTKELLPLDATTHGETRRARRRTLVQLGTPNTDDCLLKCIAQTETTDKAMLVVKFYIQHVL